MASSMVDRRGISVRALTIQFAREGRRSAKDRSAAVPARGARLIDAHDPHRPANGFAVRPPRNQRPEIFDPDHLLGAPAAARKPVLHMIGKRPLRCVAQAPSA